MKISKLYSNNDTFKTIVFDKGINFILSSNNGVGKSSLFKLIDFCLLGDKSFLGQEQQILLTKIQFLSLYLLVYHEMLIQLKYS